MNAKIITIQFFSGEHSGKKGKRKSPLRNWFRRNREDKKPVDKLFGHQLSNVMTPEELIARPVKVRYL